MIRAIAYYLPQYHPIPENDAWWGPGFTEWTNVTRARPLYPGHDQPRVPAELGYYDLRLPEVRRAQADLARDHGIEAFCYWHYWFAGRRLLDRPFREVLASGAPDFPFCLAWANQSWTGVWHGAPHRTLVAQTYPGDRDVDRHFDAVLPALTDHRALQVDGKPLFVIYAPRSLPEARRFTDRWRERAMRAGLKGLCLVGIANETWVPGDDGFDATALDTLGIVIRRIAARETFPARCRRALRRFAPGFALRPTIYSYVEAIACAPRALHPFQYPTVLPNWDNTPRTGKRGFVLGGSSPELFADHLARAAAEVAQRPPDRRLIFVKSWNEWAEGNMLEPDRRFGRGYLETVRRESIRAAMGASGSDLGPGVDSGGRGLPTEVASLLGQNELD